MVTRQDCIDGLREAANRLGHSPSRPEYQSLDVGPSVTSLQKYLGGSWNEAKRTAGLSTTIPGGKIQFNESYFAEIDTPEVAYWLGMLYGDGSVSRRGVGEPRVSLALMEREHVLAFRDALDSGHALYHDDPVWCWQANSETMATDLAEHGLDGDKTFSATVPEIDDSERRGAFIRGVFDADGHVGNNRRFNITGASRERFRTLKGWLPAEASIVDRGDGAFTLRVEGQYKLSRLYGWMYPNGGATEPKLDRKYNPTQQ